jgi:hypothetical protein
VTSADALVTAAVDALRTRLLMPDPDAEPGPIRAPWLGLGVELSPDGGWSHSQPDLVLVRVTLGHRRVDELVVPLAKRQRSGEGLKVSVLRGLNLWATNLDARIQQVSLAAVAAHEAAQDAQQAIDDHRFAQADELAAAEALLAEINTGLEASTRANAARTF